MKIRPLHTDEQKYTYRQSTQIEGQTGSIGYLRGDFGAVGKEFFSSWFDHRRDLKTDEFKSALDEVINALRSEEYGLLKSRTAMAQYAAKYPVSAFQGNYTTEYGFRADTEKYSFLIRCNPARGDYNFYGFNSRVEWCACFVSWCANECGYIDAGVIPKYAGCVNGVQWFKDRGQWLDNSAEPTPGMIIFFDWADESGQDGLSDHTGIVQKVENGRVYTVEGNSGDSVRQNSYPVGYYEILGYGAPAY